MRNEHQTESFEPCVQSFIVRVWVEDPTQDTGPAAWRGHVTHVPSGKRRYLKDLADVVDFMRPYLKRMSLSFDSTRRTETS